MNKQRSDKVKTGMISAIKTILSASIAISGLLMFSNVSMAEPAWKKTIKPFTAGSQPQLKKQKLQYSLSWNGKLNSGYVVMIFDKEDPRYKNLYLAQAYGRSSGVAGKLFPFKFSYTSFMKKKSYQPLIFASDETDAEENVIIKNTYKSSKVSHSRIQTAKKGGKVKKREKTFIQQNAHDPLSAMLYIRGRELNNGDVINVCLFPFRSAQYAKVTVLGREKHNGYNCIKLDLKIQNIDLETHKLKKYKKLKKATMWITDDADRILVELRSKVFIGDVRTTLVKRN